MRNETQEFFKFTQSKPFMDITHFWDIPYEEMLDEIKLVMKITGEDRLTLTIIK